MTQQQLTDLTVTEAAAGKAKALLAREEGSGDLSLRIAVQPGGCAGLRYQLFFDNRSLEEDLVHDYHGLRVTVDRMSAPYLAGAVIDFVDAIDKQGFTIDNPNASGSCACGDSFH
ncbi:iron-sulfur cluster assembly accessory protein [Saccharomonospora amisosensis]|uniref:Iron-sulfur cluster assembly accessory protein n=1 Tax=Saccharomonospora amisosensis TaxID=1128677 RepID=A0A7X5URQ8_9PSEU|nr:iron-sulfur cluster assembly accessory protein [Saccharomonospora amisosensis]NIJ12993.1 iron-sulfur cluster assembly accessory protein [Saccharomonospora amisosensis]